jgi:hypothetical protein
MTQPAEPPLLVPVAKVATLAGLDPADTMVQAVVEEAIRAATDDVLAHLHRFVVPTPGGRDRPGAGRQRLEPRGR